MWVGARVVLWLAVSSGCYGFEWTPGLPDGTVKYACVGDVISLPWDFRPSPGDAVLSIQWLFEGRSQEMVAMFSHGSFAPMAAYSHRVCHVTGAGLTLSHVTAEDSGNYTVYITGRDASGMSFTHRHTVVVQVMGNDRLMTTDGELHAVLQPEAIYSNTTGQWSVVVSCGHFTFQGDPPFNMEWTTPSTVAPLHNSTAYKDGYFQLHVTSGGDYTCTIPQHAAADLCLHNATRHATVHVDKMEARMTLMEARQQQLEKENEQLSLKTEQLEQENEELKQKDTSLTDYVHTLENKVTSLTQSLLQAQQREANLTDYLHTLESRLDNKDSSLTQALQTLSGKVSRQVAFTAYLRGRIHTSGGTVKFDGIVNNYGNSYNPSSGLFTAPVDGLYFFTVTSCPATNDNHPNAHISKEGAPLCQAASNFEMAGRVATCGAAVHLTAGETVSVESSYSLGTIYTSFSGFLLSSD